MKYFPLVWAALWRKRGRTWLTGLSIFVAFFLYSLLGAVNAAFNMGEQISAVDRLVTTGRYSLTQLQPYGYKQQIEGLPGVKAVTFASWFGGIWKEEKNFFAQFPVEPAPYFAMYPEFILPKEQLQAFIDTRDGAVIGRKLAERFGWKIGDVVPIQSTIWPKKDGSKVWELKIVGIFDGKDQAARAQEEQLLLQHEYFNEARQFGRDQVGWFMTRVEDPSQSVAVGKAIDALFQNSPKPTKTQTEGAFNAGFAKQFGDIGLIVSGILGAVFFTLIMLTGNTMMQSVRERIPELAVLKTLGFTDRGVLGLVLAESWLMTVGAAAVALGVAALLMPHMGIPGMLPELPLTGTAVALGFVYALALGLLVGLPPALRAMRLNIVDALGGH